MESVWIFPPQIWIDVLILSTCANVNHLNIPKLFEEGRTKLFVDLVKWEEVPFHWILMYPVVMAPRSHSYLWTFAYMWVTCGSVCKSVHIGVCACKTDEQVWDTVEENRKTDCEQKQDELYDTGNWEFCDRGTVYSVILIETNKCVGHSSQGAWATAA